MPPQKAPSRERRRDGGVATFSKEVEDALVLGLPDENWGQAVTAVARIAAGAAIDESALREYSRARLASFKTPKRIFLSARAFRAPNGKADYGAAADFIRHHLETELPGAGS